METNKLTCKDVMIGDWVYNTHNKKNEQVQEIGSGKVMLNYNDLYELDEIEPIPLTPEILKKNGFVCTQKEDELETVYECWSLRDDLLSIAFEPDVVMLEVHNGGDNGGVVRTITYYTDNNIMYLHELQHALRFCGITREINL